MRITKKKVEAAISQFIEIMNRAYGFKMTMKNFNLADDKVTIKSNIGKFLHDRQMTIYLDQLLAEQGYGGIGFKREDNNISFTLSTIEERNKEINARNKELASKLKPTKRK